MTSDSKEFESTLDFISLRDHYDEELLARFYNGLMKTNFPIEDELEELSNWNKKLDPKLRSALSPHAFVLDVILALIKNTEPDHHPAATGHTGPTEHYAAESTHPGALAPVASKSDGRTISGGIVFEYYKESGCALITYFVVDARYRKQGVVKYLISRALQKLQQTAKEHKRENVEIAFAETNATGVEDGVMPSTVRHKIMQRLGFAHVGCEYIQPPLDEGKSESYDLVLIALLESPAVKKEEKKYLLPTKKVAAWVEEFYSTTLGGETDKSVYTSLPYYQHLIKQFAQVEHLTLNPDLPWPGPASRPSTDSKLKRLIIAGPPAGGKGTQCEFLREKYDLVHLSTGDLLRAEVKEGTQLGKEAKGFMDRGELVPNHLLIGVVKERLKKIEESGKGWLLDGFPRTDDQAKALIDGGVQVSACLLLEVPDEVLVERMEGRRFDPVTNNTYHLKFFPPPDETVRARLIVRSDDNVEKFKVRLGEYHKHVKAIKDFFHSVLHVVDGNQSKQTVSESLAKILG